MLSTKYLIFHIFYLVRNKCYHPTLSLGHLWRWYDNYLYSNIYRLVCLAHLVWKVMWVCVVASRPSSLLKFIDLSCRLAGLIWNCVDVCYYKGALVCSRHQTWNFNMAPGCHLWLRKKYEKRSDGWNLVGGMVTLYNTQFAQDILIRHYVEIWLLVLENTNNHLHSETTYQWGRRFTCLIPIKDGIWNCSRRLNLSYNMAATAAILKDLFMANGPLFLSETVLL